MSASRLLLFSFFLLTLNIGYTQISDDFADGDFTANPAWTGETAFFQINVSNQLQSNGPAATDTLQLVTPNSMIDGVEWNVWVKLAFQPSTTNYLRIYLVSDQSDLEGSLNGYFIHIGETGSPDSLDFYRQDGTILTKLGTGSLGCISSTTNNSFRIKVFRDNLGNWSFETDCSGGTSYTPELSLLDNTHTNTAFFGFFCRHTSTRNDKFFFDDIFVGTPLGDTSKPVVSNITVISANQIDVFFSETVDPVTAQSASNYLVSGGIGNPGTAVVDGSNDSLVHLSFSSSFINCTSYNLDISNVEDTSGNSMNGTASQAFTYTNLSIAISRDVIINEFFPDPDSTLTQLPHAEYIELYNRSAKSFDLGNWSIEDGTNNPQSLPSYILCANEFVLLCKAADTSKFNSFGAVIPVSLPSLNNTGDQIVLKDNNGTILDSLEYDLSWYNDAVKDDGGWALELINPNDSCAIASNWSASTHPRGGTPDSTNSIFDTTPDNTAPALLSVLITGVNSLQLCFDEKLDATSAGTIGNYSVNNALGSPSVATLVLPGMNCVDLQFSTNLDTGTIYTITINNLADCNGNVAGTLSQNFALGSAGNSGDVVITEIFPDPAPSAGLPEVEFIEIRNISQNVIDLNNWKLTDRGATAANFGPYTLMPGAYLILGSASSVDTFSSYGNTLGISNFPGLNNASDSLELFNSNNTLVDKVYYSDEWYGDDSKDDGGYSLERIDEQFPCNNGENWRASTFPAGGTPGVSNSVAGTFTDTDAPRVVRASVISSMIVRIYFDEEMDPANLNNVGNYTIDNGIGNPIIANGLGPSYETVDLLLAVALDTNTTYQVTVSGLMDCPGNGIGLDNQAYFGIASIPRAGDIIINEILFNPLTGGSDYVELYNLSDQIFDLQNLRIGEIAEGTDSIINSKTITFQSYLLFPQAYVCLTASKSFQLNTYSPIDPDAIFEMSSFPSYDDNSGEVIIFTDLLDTLDRFYYEDDYHFVNLDDDNGVSLERLSFTTPTQQVDNWHSAASNVNYGTPGYKNSQQLIANPAEGEVSVNPEIFSPDNDGIDDVVSINYTFPFVGNNARVTVYDHRGRVVKLLQQNTLLGTESGNFTWDGSDDFGNKADIGIYVVLFEVANPVSGKKEAYKVSVVLAARLD